MKKIALLFALSITVIACKSDDDGVISPVNIEFSFTQNWDGTSVSAADFGSTIYTNEHGEEIYIARLRYLISRLSLTDSNGLVTNIDGYNLIDLSDPTTFNFNPNITIAPGAYTLSFIHGFNEADNIDGEYPDLNAASWNWPAMLGGGYHFMQFDGTYDVNALPKPFNYHNGTARVSDGVFEQNFVEVNLPNIITIQNDADIEIEMNISEWFKNPYTWDLNVYDTPLMPNYDAQKLMQLNASTVYSLGAVTQ